MSFLHFIVTYCLKIQYFTKLIPTIFPILPYGKHFAASISVQK